MSGGRIDFEAVAARAALADIVGRVVGLRRAGREWVGCCPFHAEKTPSFSVYADKAGREKFKCFGCGAQGDAVDFVTRFYGVGLTDAVRIVSGGEPPRIAGAVEGPAPDPAREDRAQREAARAREDLARARQIWRGAKWRADGLVARYLGARGIDLDRIGGVPQSLRETRLPYWGPDASGAMRNFGVFPAMVAPIQGADGLPIGLHRTFLREDGAGKLEIPAPSAPSPDRAKPDHPLPVGAREKRALPAKKVLGRMAGGAIRLGPATEKIWLAEGIETALSVAQALHGREAPGSVWTAVALGNFATVGLPPCVRAVTILADNDMARGDSSGGGGRGRRDPRAFLRAQAATLAARGLEVRIAWAPEGMDFNDVLRAGGGSGGDHGG